MLSETWMVWVNPLSKVVTGREVWDAPEFHDFKSSETSTVKVMSVGALLRK